jgi:hypothetical protein
LGHSFWSNFVNSVCDTKVTGVALEELGRDRAVEVLGTWE